MRQLMKSTLILLRLGLLRAVILTHQLTKLHDEEKRDGFTALTQTLKDVGMLQAPERRTKDR